MKPIEPRRRIEAAVLRHAAGERVVLAISGGRDSMVLLHAAARVLSPEALTVASYDHATGAAAGRAVAHVADTAARLGLPVVIGRAGHDAGTEAGWRALRQRFLREVASAVGGRIMTGHTRDDQVETVLMRVLRGTGARGLAGLNAGTALRPLLGFSRDEVAAYARSAGVAWVEDPTNHSHDFLRNRVRHDLLPALSRVAPGLGDELLATARRAAEIRGRLDAWVARLADVAGDGSRLSLPAKALRGRDAEELALIWPAAAARVGLAMDRRGTLRAAAFTTSGRVGARIPLSGGWTISRSGDRFDLHRPAAAAQPAALQPGLSWGEWRFGTLERQATEMAATASDLWVALLPAGGLRVRVWQPGDRMRSGGMNRRVKRYLSDAGVTGEPRTRWPVVLDGDEIVWIPGVRRSDAAAVRSGRPEVLLRCEYDHR